MFLILLKIEVGSLLNSITHIDFQNFNYTIYQSVQTINVLKYPHRNCSSPYLLNVSFNRIVCFLFYSILTYQNQNVSMLKENYIVKNHQQMALSPLICYFILLAFISQLPHMTTLSHIPCIAFSSFFHS